MRPQEMFDADEVIGIVRDACHELDRIADWCEDEQAADSIRKIVETLEGEF